MKKKWLNLLAATGALALLLVGCGSTNRITVLSREEGSGTRDAFGELFGIVEKDAEGNKHDGTIDAAEITSSTSVMLTTVEGNRNAIGYVSLGALSDTVKAVTIDGQAPTAENVKNGSYPIARPFNIVTRDGLSELARDFMAFILSSDGQAVVEKAGYIPVETTEAYHGNKPSGTVLVVGSTSVAPVMEKLAEAYERINSGAKIQVQQNDSSTGISSAIGGDCDIGMASRALKDSETAKGVSGTQIAIDGIAVIVNKENTVTNLTREEVKAIYTGEKTTWG